MTERSQAHGTPASTANLHRLFVLRNIAITAQVGAVLISLWYLELALPVGTLFAVIGALAAFNVFTALRLRRGPRVSHFEFLVQLLVDIMVFTVLLYLTGGATNPFALLYLMPMTIAATVLPGRYTWFIAIVTAACYSLLLWTYIPLPHSHMGMDDFGLHVLGMWLGFVLSAGLIAYFVVGMGDTLRRREQALAAAREQALRDQQLVTLGTLAASTAHELGTPLGTMALLVEELDETLPEDQRATTATLRQQIARCKEALSNLSSSAGAIRLTGGSRLTVDRYLQAIIDEWRDTRSGIELSTQFDGEIPAPSILADRTLTQALINILDNAADVSPSEVACEAAWSCDSVRLEILDRGPGLADEARHRAGEMGFSSKPDGMGLGLFLAHAIIRRFGGGVQLLNREGGGICTRITLPLGSAIGG
ncbi:MAG: ATP-binding protein [Chromatiales bacterium]|jgi:two-component system sensor histidine kinase RegB